MVSPILTMEGITKRFPGVLAVKGASLEVYPGQVLALVGENGAGKSTLMKILGGIHQPDEGTIRMIEQPVAITDVATAKSLGIALIHQELMLAPNLDVAGNIFLGAEHGYRILGLPAIDRKSMHREAAKLLEQVGLQVSPATPVASLTTGQMQMVEIAKALAINARIIVMDEPTSSLTASEAERLFAIIDKLRNAGIAIIYISHRIDEILRIADRITVMRDGERVGDLDARSTNHDQIVSTMVGRELSNWFPQRAGKPGEPVLELNEVLVPGARHPVSLTVRKGEILGFAGLVGSGRTELMRVLFGIDEALSGQMTLMGKAYRPRKPKDAIREGVYLVPEDRKEHGLVLPMSIAQNVSLPDIGNYRPRGWLQRGRELEVAKQQVQRLAIKTPTVHQRAVNLSGGNQQKVVLAKWLAMDPRILILDEPTRGIDVGAKAEIYRQMAELADAGITILMVSSEMEEVLGMSDRVVVMNARRITGILERDQLNEENVLALMTGKEKAA